MLQKIPANTYKVTGYEKRRIFQQWSGVIIGDPSPNQIASVIREEAMQKRALGAYNTCRLMLRLADQCEDTGGAHIECDERMGWLSPE